MDTKHGHQLNITLVRVGVAVRVMPHPRWLRVRVRIRVRFIVRVGGIVHPDSDYDQLGHKFCTFREPLA